MLNSFTEEIQNFFNIYLQAIYVLCIAEKLIFTLFIPPFSQFIDPYHSPILAPTQLLLNLGLLILL